MFHRPEEKAIHSVPEGIPSTLSPAITHLSSRAAEMRKEAIVLTWHIGDVRRANAVADLIGHYPGHCPRCADPQHGAETRAMLRLLRVQEGNRLQALLRSVPLLRADPHRR